MTENGWTSRIRMKEVFRYLGMREADADASLHALADEQLERLLRTARVRSFYQIFPLAFQSEGHFTLGPMEIESRALGKNLRGCEQAAVFGVTLGVEVDRLIYRLGRTAVGEAAITDACAAAVVEAVCDELCDELRGKAASEGCTLRPRFSPGFADFTLEYQKMVLDALQLSKRIGVSLTDGGMMTPTKSVTAIAGFYRPSEQ